MDGAEGAEGGREGAAHSKLKSHRWPLVLDSDKSLIMIADAAGC